MPKLRCSICDESLPVENFRFFNCGHGLCGSCTRQTHFETTCPFCRRPKGTPHQIFLNFSEPTVTERASSIADGLAQMNANSPSTSFERAGRKLKDVSQHVDEDTANYLLEAAQNLTERMAPLTTMLELERAENAVYQKQIADLEAKLKQTVPLEENVAQLRAQLGEMEKNYEKAALLAEESNRRAANKQEHNKRLAESLERHRRALTKQEEALEEAKQALELQKKEVDLWRRKLKVLSKSAKRRKVQTQDPDASLLVEPPIVEDGKKLVDLDLDFDLPPQLKTKTNLPDLRIKKRRFNPVAIGN